MVDEDAHELVADGLVHERGGDRRVDAAGEPGDDAGRADLLADARDLLGDHVAGVPVGGDARGAVQEVLDHALPELGVLDLGVPLHAVEALLVVRERRDGRRGRGGEHLEALGGDGHGVAVAHPHRLRLGLAGEQRVVVVGAGGDRGRAVLAVAGVRDLAAELLRHHLEAVADAERRHAEPQDALVERGRSRLVHRRRAAREHDAHGVLRAHLLGRDGVRHDLRVDGCLAHAPRDQLRVLGAEVDDEDGALLGGCSGLLGRLRCGLVGHCWASTVSAVLARGIRPPRGGGARPPRRSR